MKAQRVWFVTIWLLCGVLVGCHIVSSTPTGTPPVVQLMPDLPGYRVIEADALQDHIVALADGAALLSGNPEMVALIEKADGVITCYRNAGAINLRIFSYESFPLSAGAIAIADRNRLADPLTLFRCAGEGMVAPFSSQPTLDPCAHRYTLERDNNEFYIIFVGTTLEICQTFCENLEGCSVP
jgi:hypothetical protein